MFKKFENFRDRFLEDCREWYKLWSTWLAALWGVIVTAVWNEPETLQQITSLLPAEYRALLSPLVFAVIAGLPIFVRLLKQNLPKEPPKV